MKNIQIANQFEPSSLQNIVILSSEEENFDILKTADEIAPEPEEAGELVDFFITPPATASIRAIVGWTKVLIFCMVAFSLIELFLFTLNTLNAADNSFAGILSLLRSVLSTGFFVWLIILSVKFVRTMGKALKSNDTILLTEAFRHQATYFKWVFLNIAVTISYAIFEALF